MRAANSSLMNMRQARSWWLGGEGYGTAFRLDRGVHPFVRHFDELLDDGRIVGERCEANALAGIAFKFLRWRQHDRHHSPTAACRYVTLLHFCEKVSKELARFHNFNL